MDLKDQVKGVIRAAIICHAIAFAAIVAMPRFDFSSLDQFLRSAGDTAAAVALGGGLVALARLFLLGLVPTVWRDRIAHLKMSFPLPGTRAFSEIGKSDDRVDLGILTKKYGLLPDHPKDQNRLFYKMSKAVGTDLGVRNAHKNYLAARDITAATWIALLPLAITAFCVTEDFDLSIKYFGSLACIAILFSFVTRNYGERFVQNVLATASAENSVNVNEIGDSQLCT